MKHTNSSPYTNGAARARQEIANKVAEITNATEAGMFTVAVEVWYTKAEKNMPLDPNKYKTSMRTLASSPEEAKDKAKKYYDNLATANRREGYTYRITGVVKG